MKRMVFAAISLFALLITGVLAMLGDCGLPSWGKGTCNKPAKAETRTNRLYQGVVLNMQSSTLSELRQIHKRISMPRDTGTRSNEALSQEVNELRQAFIRLLDALLAEPKEEKVV